MPRPVSPRFAIEGQAAGSVLTAADIAGGVPVDLDLGPDGEPRRPVIVVDLSARPVPDAEIVLGRLAAALPVVIGIGPVHSNFMAQGCDVVLSAARPCGPWEVRVPDTEAAAQELVRRVAGQPRAAVSLVSLLRQTEVLDVRRGLAAESSVYSALLGGPDFARWLAGRMRRSADDVQARAAVSVARRDTTLQVTMHRPTRRNAINATARDALLEAFAVAEADPALTVEWTGEGPSFSAGGDLDEFGTTPDPATAHLIRLDRSLGWAVHCLSARMLVRLHGACLGAGLELPAFAGRVSAHPDTFAGLPELGMGLIPGAGGTVSVTRRIGRWRTAWLVLSGTAIDAATALDWGLVDALGP
jgi:enoyl-CoA hydratase/carnithine racemase